MSDADLIARARELGAPMLAPEPAIARRSVLLLALADRVEELEGLLREVEWRGDADVETCPICFGPDDTVGHAPGCRLARALGQTSREASDAVRASD